MKKLIIGVFFLSLIVLNIFSIKDSNSNINLNSLITNVHASSDDPAYIIIPESRDEYEPGLHCWYQCVIWDELYCQYTFNFPGSC